jgi:hypothetical protein
VTARLWVWVMEGVVDNEAVAVGRQSSVTSSMWTLPPVDEVRRRQAPEIAVTLPSSSAAVHSAEATTDDTPRPDTAGIVRSSYLG